MVKSKAKTEKKDSGAAAKSTTSKKALNKLETKSATKVSDKKDKDDKKSVAKSKAKKAEKNDKKVASKLKDKKDEKKSKSKK